MAETKIHISIQSQNLEFSDWISLLTLSLTPLFAHLISGVPSPTYLCNTRPRWHDRITHYNPTSIYWRYFAVTDRRLRSKSWTPRSLAASNALFWTSKGWNGSEEMVKSSNAFFKRDSYGTHISLISASTIKTIVITIQGLQAQYLVMQAIFGRGSWHIALDSLFYPLAILGLVRLPAAFWLVDEKTYHNYDSPSSFPISDVPFASKIEQSTLSLLTSPDNIDQERYRPPWGKVGILVRAFFMAVLLTLSFTSCWELIPHPSATLTHHYSLTAYAITLLNIYLLVVTIAIMAISITRGASTTIIPCISKWWYKLYTLSLFAAILGCFIIAALETRKTPCGQFTSFPSQFDTRTCARSFFVQAEGAIGTAIGVVERTQNGSVKVVTFDGWCQYDQWKGLLNESISVDSR
jgi:hypothetical protein